MSFLYHQCHNILHWLWAPWKCCDIRTRHNIIIPDDAYPNYLLFQCRWLEKPRKPGVFFNMFLDYHDIIINCHLVGTQLTFSFVCWLVMSGFRNSFELFYIIWFICGYTWSIMIVSSSTFPMRCVALSWITKLKKTILLLFLLLHFLPRPLLLLPPHPLLLLIIIISISIISSSLLL